MVENSRVTINPNVWDSILGFTAIFALVGMTTTWVWRKVKPEPNEELENLESQIRRTAAKLHDADENAAHAREHFTKLMRDYGLTVMPTTVQMSRYRVLRVAKDR